MLRSSLLCIICLAFAAIAWADDAALGIPFSKGETILAPVPFDDIRTHASLDTAQPDTIYYDDGNPGYYYPSLTNYWVYVKFTAPTAFQLRSIYIVISSDVNATCSLYVHAAGTGTNPGTYLGATAVNVVSGFYVYDADLPAPIDFTAGQSFLIVAGRVAGGDPGWHMNFDAATTTNRSRTTNSNGNRLMGPYYLVQGDYYIRAGGALAPFTDLAAKQCFNGIQPSGEASFNVLPGTAMNLKAEVRNAGNTPVANLTANWSVRGPGGTVVYTNEVVGGPLSAGSRTVLQSSTSYTPMADGEYNVICVSHTDGDASAENDTARLRFFVGEQPRWFRYDDNATPESHVNASAGNGWGVSFKPVTYSASVESIRVELSVTGVVSGNFRIYLNDAQGTPVATPVWETASVITTGWNQIAVEPPQLVYQGQSFTLVYLWTNGAALGMDGTPPNCADIDSMGVVSWSVSSSGSEFDADNSGNWSMQVYMDTSTAQPPIIETNPSDSLLFGRVDTTGNNFSAINLVLHNYGTNDPIVVSQLVILPGTIRSVFDIEPEQVTIQPLDSEIVVITFNPTAVRAYIGTLSITNTSVNMPTIILPVRAEGVRPGAAADDREFSLPQEYSLEQNFPNPFNPTTEIRFALPVASDVKLTVFNLLGQEMAVLAEGPHTAGMHAVTFDASQLPAGVYFYRLNAGTFSDIRKMLLLK